MFWFLLYSFLLTMRSDLLIRWNRVGHFASKSRGGGDTFLRFVITDHGHTEAYKVSVGQGRSAGVVAYKLMQDIKGRGPRVIRRLHRELASFSGTDQYENRRPESRRKSNMAKKERAVEHSFQCPHYIQSRQGFFAEKIVHNAAEIGIIGSEIIIGRGIRPFQNTIIFGVSKTHGGYTHCQFHDW